MAILPRMLNRFVRGAVRAGQTFLQTAGEVRAESEAPPPPVPAEKAETEVERLKRINADYWGLITRMEKQRDEWKEMFLVQAREHQRAQSMLENSATRLGQMLQNTIGLLNRYRAEKNEPPMKPADLRLPKGVSEAYGAEMKALQDGAEPLIDGAAERAKIPT